MKSPSSTSSFMPNLLLFISFFSVNLCLYRLSHSLSLCLSSWANPICVNTNATLKPTMPSQPERWLFFKGTGTQPLHRKIVSISVVWSSCHIPCFFYITYWLACRHDNNTSLWQQTSQELDSRVFGHVMLLKAFPGVPCWNDCRRG